MKVCQLQIAWVENMETHIVSVQYTGKVCFWFQKAITGISGSPSKGQLTEIDILIFSYPLLKERVMGKI